MTMNEFPLSHAFAQHVALVALILSCSVETAAEAISVDWSEHRAIADLFSDAGVVGTFAVCRQPDGLVTGHHAQRALKRFPPASTFKVPHTLIALETGAVSGPDEKFEWDGVPRTFRSWERDMSLVDALQASNVPVYRDVAGRIGRERMQAYLETFGYGSREVGESMTDFWLVGPLEISAVEQCRFLLRLAAGELSVADEHLQTLRTMLATDVGNGVTLYAKTGWATAPDPGPGWWAGWVEGPFGRAGFALNIDMPEPAYARLRSELGSEALHLLGLLPH